MSENSYPNLLTSQGYQALYSRYGFTQAQKGSAAVLNEALVEMTKKLTRQGILQAEHEGHSGLSGAHAKKAIEMTPEIPNGFY